MFIDRKIEVFSASVARNQQQATINTQLLNISKLNYEYWPFKIRMLNILCDRYVVAQYSFQKWWRNEGRVRVKDGGGAFDDDRIFAYLVVKVE